MQATKLTIICDAGKGKPENEMTQELVKSLFDYREDGVLIWKVGQFKGYIAGSLRLFKKNKKPTWRRSLQYQGKRHLCYRLIFLWHNGYMPPLVDHIDRDSANDRIENLREATVSQNSANRIKKMQAKSKYVGVSFDRINNVWMMQCRSIKLKVYKEYKTETEAALQYNRYAVKAFGEFATLNIIQP